MNIGLWSKRCSKSLSPSSQRHLSMNRGSIQHCVETLLVPVVRACFQQLLTQSRGTQDCSNVKGGFRRFRFWSGSVALAKPAKQHSLAIRFMTGLNYHFLVIPTTRFQYIETIQRQNPQTAIIWQHATHSSKASKTSYSKLKESSPQKWRLLCTGT